MSEKFLLDQPIDNYIKIRQLNEFMMGHKGYIAGGVFKNIFNNEKIKDVDIFFESEKDFKEAVEYYKEHDDYKKGYENSRVVSYYHEKSGILVELIRHSFKSALDMLEDFDFTVTQFAFYKETEEDSEGEESMRWKIAFHKRFFEHLLLKRLVVEKDAEDLVLPISTYNRMFRYAEYGYFPCRETKVKLIEALRSLPEFSEEMLAAGLYHGMD